MMIDKSQNAQSMEEDIQVLYNTFTKDMHIDNESKTSLNRYVKSARSKSFHKLCKITTRAFKENKTFVSLNKERKFKAYMTKSSNNRSKNNQFHNNLFSNHLKSSLQISNYSTANGTNILYDTFKNQKTFFTDISSTIPRPIENKQEKIIGLYKKIFNNDLQEAEVYQSVNIGSEVKSLPIIDKKVKQVPYSITIDPDFFIKYPEKPINKTTTINFNLNPKLIKRGLKNLHKNALFPDLNEKFFNSFDNSKGFVPFTKIQNKVYDEYYKKKETLKKHDMFKKENTLDYTDTFNKFTGNKLTIRSDFKTLVYNSRTSNLSDGNNIIKDLIKSEMNMRSTQRGFNPNKNKKEPIKLQKIHNSSFVYNKMNKSVHDVLENLKELDFNNIKNLNCSYLNEKPKENKNKIIPIFKTPFELKSKIKNNIIIKDSVQELSPIKISKSKYNKRIQDLKLKQNSHNIEIRKSDVFSQNVKFQDKKITNVLKNIFDEVEINKMMKFG